MGVLDRFEKGIERAVNGAFAKAFRSEVQPVEIASALRRECDEKAAVVGRDRTIAPNAFVVELGRADHDRLGEWEAALGDELSAAVHEHARQQSYAFVGPVRVLFEQAEDLDTGVFRVRSTTARPDPAAGPAPGARPWHEQAAAAPPRPDLPAAPPYPGAPPAGYAPAPAPAAPGGWPPIDAPVAPAAAAPTAPAPSWATPTAGALGTLDVDGRPHPVDKPVTVIGRAMDVDVVLDDPGVSRRHAEVHVVDGRARVIDLGSTNGTFLDGERVHAGSLTDGSMITVGRTRITYHPGQR